MSRGKCKQDDVFTFRLPSDLRAQLEAKAAEAHITPSKALRNLVQRLARNEVRLWPMGLGDIRKNPLTESELLELAEMLSETRQVVRDKSSAIYTEAEAIGSQIYKLAKLLRQTGRGSAFLDRLDEMLGAMFDVSSERGDFR